MTIGIYSLYWEEQDLIYIGQSQNIERRFREHILDLTNNRHSNYKVQNTYNKFGLPKFIIIEECNLINLNDLEIYWQHEFNSLNSLDLVKAGQVGSGINSNNSKYSKMQILKVFRLLYSTNLTHEKVSNKTLSSINLSQAIFIGKSHLWLKEKYPILYTRMQNTIRNGNYTLEYKKLKSPEGVIYEFQNIREFSRIHGLNQSAVSKLLAGKYKHHHKWTRE